MIVSEILEKQATIETLAISDLLIDREYQRTVSMSKVKLISERFNVAAAGVLVVNMRIDGRIFLIDGQHRLEAMKKCGLLTVQCRICYGLTQSEEAEIYVYCNTARKNPSALDTFRARLIRGDAIAETINRIVDECGLMIDFSLGHTHGRSRSSKSIWAVQAMEEIYQRAKGGKEGEKLLKEVLMLASRSWPDEGDAMKSFVLLGLTLFHLKYQGRYHREEFIAKMHITDFKALNRRAQYHAESSGGSIHTAFAKALQEAYDKGRKSRRLEGREA